MMYTHSSAEYWTLPLQATRYPSVLLTLMHLLWAVGDVHNSPNFVPAAPTLYTDSTAAVLKEILQNHVSCVQPRFRCPSDVAKGFPDGNFLIFFFNECAVKNNLFVTMMSGCVLIVMIYAEEEGIGEGGKSPQKIYFEFATPLCGPVPSTELTSKPPRGMHPFSWRRSRGTTVYRNMRYYYASIIVTREAKRNRQRRRRDEITAKHL